MAILVADISGALVLRDQGPDRPAGYGKADHSLQKSDACTQDVLESVPARSTPEITTSHRVRWCPPWGRMVESLHAWSSGPPSRANAELVGQRR